MKKTVVLLMLVSGLIYSDLRAQDKPTKKDKEATELLTGVWAITNVSDGKPIPDDQKDAVNKMMAEILKDSYLFFQADGRFSILISGKEESGTWKITDNGKKLMMSNNRTIKTEPMEITKLTKTEFSVSQISKDASVMIFTVRQGDALTENEITNRDAAIASYKDEQKRAVEDSIAAMEAVKKAAHQALIDDSTAKAIATQEHVINFAPCYYLKLICVPFETDASNIKLELISKNETYNFYKSMINLPDSKRCEYGFEKSSDRPRQFNAVFGENLSEKDAVELYKRELTVFKQCKTGAWTEPVHSENPVKWSYTEISGDEFGNAKELSIEIKPDEVKGTYIVRLHIEEE